MCTHTDSGDYGTPPSTTPAEYELYHTVRNVCSRNQQAAFRTHFATRLWWWWSLWVWTVGGLSAVMLNRKLVRNGRGCHPFTHSCTQLAFQDWAKRKEHDCEANEDYSRGRVYGSGKRGVQRYRARKYNHRHAGVFECCQVRSAWAGQLMWGVGCLCVMQVCFFA